MNYLNRPEAAALRELCKQMQPKLRETLAKPEVQRALRMQQRSVDARKVRA